MHTFLDELNKNKKYDSKMNKLETENVLEIKFQHYSPWCAYIQFIIITEPEKSYLSFFKVMHLWYTV